MNPKSKQHLRKKPISHSRPVAPLPDEESPTLWVKHIGKSLLISVCGGVILSLIASLIAYFSADPDSLTLPLGLVASALTALIGGFSAVRIHGHAALLCGLLNGAAMTALMMLVSLFFTSLSAGHSALISALLHTAFILLSVAGAYIGISQKSQKPKRIKR